MKCMNLISLSYINFCIILFSRKCAPTLAKAVEKNNKYNSAPVKYVHTNSANVISYNYLGYRILCVSMQ